MTQKFIAITHKGQEYIFSKTHMIAVPTKSAEFIKETLNKKNYMLKENEVWHIYDNDWYYDQLINDRISRVIKGRFAIVWGGYYAH